MPSADANNDRLVAECERYFKSVPDEVKDRSLRELIRALGDPALPDVGRQTMTWDEVRSTMDVTTFGAHTHTHPLLSRVGSERVELRSPDVARPNRRGNRRHAEALCLSERRRHAGGESVPAPLRIRAAFSTSEGLNDAGTDWLEVRRWLSGPPAEPEHDGACMSVIAAAVLPEPPVVRTDLAGPLHVDILEDWSAVAALEPEWNALLRESSADSLFLTWEWVKCWVEVVGAHLRPLVVCVRDARGALAGLAPFYRVTFVWASPSRIKCSA